MQLLASRVVVVQSHHWKSKPPQHPHHPPHPPHPPHPQTNRSFHSKASDGLFIFPTILGHLSLSTTLFSHTNVTRTERTMSSMAKKYAMQEKQKIYISSPGQLVSPFLPVQAMPSLASSLGWAARYRLLKNAVVSLISGQQIKSKLKPLNEKFNSRIFRNSAKELYSAINTAIAAGDIGKLRGLLTENMYSTVAKEMELKARAGHKSVNLSWSANLETPQVVCVRFTRVSAEKLEDFGQVTVYFHGKQSINVNDVSGKVLSTTTSNVSEYWTFERHLQKYGSWRLCAKPTHASIENLGW